jgi:uncharacterized protein (TIGR03083 family)
MKEFWLDALRREAAAFRGAVSEEDLDKPVPPCPKWNVAALVGHLGGVYRWAQQVTTSGTQAPRHVGGSPPAGAAVLGWWTEAYEQCLAALEQADPDAPCWTWSTASAFAPGEAGFWHRRMAHETSVHRWDMQAATGLPEPVDAELAADGIAEVVDTFLPTGRRAAEPAIGVTRLVTTDLARDWLIRQREGGAVSLLDQGSVGHQEPDPAATAAGTASDVLLALWGRVPISTLTVDGDPALVDSLRTR